MKKKMFYLAATLLGLVCFGLLSFTLPFGGDCVRIYLDKQLVFEQFMHADRQTHTVTLHASDRAKNMEVQFSHCGVSGKERTLVLKEGNREIKKWKFANAAPSNLGMLVPVKEVLDAVKKDSKKLTLVYSSKELTEGKVIAGMEFEGLAVAMK